MKLTALPCLCADVFDGTEEIRTGGEAMNFAVHAAKFHGIDVALVGGHIVDAVTHENHIALIRVSKAADDPQGGGFTAAGLTYNTNRFSTGNVKGYAVNSSYDTYIGEKICMEIIELNYVVGIVHLCQIFLFRNILAVALFLYLPCNAPILS